MNLTQKLKSYERKIVFMKWSDEAEYGKIKYVGNDFIEFEVIDEEDLSYAETVLINPSLIIEIVTSSSDINRLIIELCSNLPVSQKK